MSQQTQTLSVEEQIQEVSAAVLSIKRDGRFVRNMTPAEWRRATMRQKFDAATNIGLETISVSIYRDIKFIVSAYERLEIEGARDIVEVNCDLDEVRNIIWRYCGRNPVFIILTSAVALKSAVGPLYNMRLVNQIHTSGSFVVPLVNGDDTPGPHLLSEIPARHYNVPTEGEIERFLRDNPYVDTRTVETVGLRMCNCGAWRLPLGNRDGPHRHICRFGRDDHVIRDAWARAMRDSYHDQDWAALVDEMMESDEDFQAIAEGPMRVQKQAASNDAMMWGRGHLAAIRAKLIERSFEEDQSTRDYIAQYIKNEIDKFCRLGLCVSEIMELTQYYDLGELLPELCGSVSAVKQSDSERASFEQMMASLTHDEKIEALERLRTELDFPVKPNEKMKGKSWSEWLGFGNPSEDLKTMADSAKIVASESESTGKKVRDFVTKIEEPIERILATIGDWTSCAKMPEVLSFIVDIMAGAYSDGHTSEERYEHAARAMENVRNGDKWYKQRSLETKGTMYPVLRLIFRALTILGIMPSMIRALITKFSSAIGWIVTQFSTKKLQEAEMKKTYRGQKQSDNDSFVGLAVAAVGTSLLGVLPDDKKLRAVSERVRLFNQGTMAMRKIEDLVAYILGIIPVCVKEWLCIISPSERVAKMLVEDGDARKWIEEVDYLEMMKTEIVRNYDLQERSLKARTQGQTFMADLALKYKDAKDTSKIFSVVMRYQTMAKALGDAVDQVRRDKGVRPTPFCLYVTGPAGVGKSTVAKSLVHAVIPKDFNADNAIYSRNSAATFWDSYHTQFCVLNDDFFQNRDATDVAEVISMVSNNTYFPEFASMTDPKMGVKGTAFNSPLVMLLSNTAYPEVTNKDIRCDEAFMRRRNILVKIVPNADACVHGTQRVREDARDAENWSHVRFHILDPLDKNKENSPLEILTYKEFVFKFMADYHNWTRRELNSLNNQAKGEAVKSLREQWEAENAWINGPLLAEKQAWFKNPFTGRVENVEEKTCQTKIFEPSEEVKYEIKCLSVDAENEKNKYPMWKNLAWIGAICGGIGLTIYTLYRLYNRFWGVEDVLPVPAKPVLKQSMSERTMRRSGAEARRRIVAQSLRDNQGQISDLKRSCEAFPMLLDLPRLVRALERYGRCLRESNEKITLGSFDDEAMKTLASEEMLVNEVYNSLSPDWMEVSFGLLSLTGDQWDREMGNLISSLVATVDSPSEEVRLHSKLAMDCVQRRDRAGASLATAKLLGSVAKEENDDIKTLNDAAKLGLLTARMGTMQAHKQGCIDQQATDLAEGPFMKHVCSLKNEVSGDKLCGLMIVGSVVMAPRHLFSTEDGLMKDGDILSWKPVEGGSAVKVAFRKDRYVPLVDANGNMKDVVLFDLGKTVRAYSDIRNHFPSAANLYKYTHLDGLLIVKHFDRDMPALKSLAGIKPVTSVVTNGVVYDNYGEDVRSMDSWMYRGNTTNGDCGAPIVAFNSKLPQKLIGIHTYAVAGDELSGGEVVSRDQIDKAMCSLKEPIVGNPVLLDLDGLERAWPYLERTLDQETNISLIGVAQSNRVVRGATKTRIRKTPYFQKVMVNDKEPAPLTSDDPRVLEEYRESPLVKGIENFGLQKGEPYEPELLENAIRDTIHEVLAFTSKDPRFVATESEAINGMQFSSCDSLNMKSSAGYPYVLNRKVGESGKHGLIKGEIGDLKVVDPELRRRLDERENEFAERRMVESTWTASLKDELRPIAKVAMNKTRTFIMGPLDNTIISRRYLLALNSAMFRNHGKPGFFYAPGIDPQSVEWDRMIRDMLEMSDVGFSGDYGRYDSTLQAELMDGVRRVADAFYENDPSGLYKDTEKAKNVRACLFHEYAHCTVLVGNQVTQKHRGNPSGCNCTTLNNGICNIIHAKYVWQKVMPAELKDLVFFHANVRAKNFGDDIIFAVKKAMLQYFNAVSYAQVSAEVGMEFTNADKASEVVAVEKVLEMTFLKQGFLLRNGRYLATLDKSSIAAMFNWISDTPEVWRATEENACAALRYAWAYGRKFYDELREKAMMEAASQGYMMGLPTFTYFDMAYAKTGALPSLAYDPFEVYAYSEVEHGPLHAVAQSDKMGNGEHDEPGGGKPAERIGEEGAMGIVQIEQTEVVKVEKPKASDEDKIAMSGAPDFKWTMMNTVEKPHLVLTGTWADTDSQLTTKNTILLPQGMISEDSVAHTPFLLHAFWRGKIEVHVSITGTKFNTGRMIMYFVPLMNVNASSGRIQNLPQITSLPHVFLDPADNSGGKLVIPFTHPNGFLNIRDPAPIDMLGTFYLRVANVLRVGAGQPSTVGYSITVRFLESDFQIQIPTEILPSRISEKVLINREKRVERERAALARMRAKQVELAGGAPLKVVAQGNYSSKVFNLDHSIMKTVGDEVQTSENKLDVKASELDYPNVNVQGPTMRRVGMGQFSNCDNIDFNERLALHPGDAKSVIAAETFATTQDEMELKWLFQMPNWFKTLSWSSTQAAGTVIWAGLMCPLEYSLGGGYLLSGTAEMSTRDWASAKFTYWQGDLKLRLQLIASMYHTGKLFVSLMYGVYNDPNTLTLEQVTSTKGFYIDINSIKHDFEFTFDWFSPKPYLKIPNGPETGTAILERAMGTYSIWIVEPLRMGPGVAGTVDINLWNYSGESYDVSLLAENNATMIVSDPDAITPLRVVKQSMESTMNGGGKPFNINQEKINSVKDVLKRRTMFNLRTGQGPVGYNIGEMLWRNRNQTTWVGGDGGSPSQSGRGLSVWFGNAYRGYHGSTRFRVQYLPHQAGPVAANVDGGMMIGYLNGSAGGGGGLTSEQYFMVEGMRAQTFIPDSPALDMRSLFLQSTPAITWSDPGCNVLDVEVPFYAAEKFKIISSGSTLDSITTVSDEANVGTFFISPPGPFVGYDIDGTRVDYSGKAGLYKVWIAGGDDLRCGVFLGPPKIVLLTSNLGSDHYV